MAMDKICNEGENDALDASWKPEVSCSAGVAERRG